MLAKDGWTDAQRPADELLTFLRADAPLLELLPFDDGFFLFTRLGNFWHSRLTDSAKSCESQSVNSQPVLISQPTYAAFQSAATTLLATGTGVGYGWRRLGNIRLVNGNYQQYFQQFFPLMQPYAGPSVYATWTTQIPSYF